MKKIAALYTRVFKFIETPTSTKRLAFFRIAVASLALFKILIVLPVLNDYYGQYGIVQWTISKLSIGELMPHLGDLSVWLQKTFSISAEASFDVLFWGYILFFLFLLTGLLTRLMAVACWLFHLAWINTGGGLVYGVDVFTQIALFYLMFIPSNRAFSLDVLLGLVKRKAASISGGIALRLVQIQLCLVYFSSGLEKAMSDQWWNGEAIWRALMIPSFNHFDVTFVTTFRILPITLGIFTVLAETLYAVLVWIPRYRVIGILAIFLLHFSIGLFMGLWTFSMIMIILSSFAFGKECYNDISQMIAERKTKMRNKPAITTGTLSVTT